MTLAPASHRAYTYTVTVPPTELPVTLAIFKEFLKLDPDDDSQDTLLTMFLSAATVYAEKLTKRNFIQRTYTTFRDFFPVPGQNEGYYPAGIIPAGVSGISFITDNVGFEIRKSPLVSVTSVTYTDLDNDAQTVSSSIYYNSVELDYSEVLTSPDQDWPEDAVKKLQNIVITFVCGMSEDAATFLTEHANLVNALLMHATMMYQNRGDCGACGIKAPPAAESIYMQCQIINI